MSQILNNPNEFDLIGDVLDTLRFRGSMFFHSELAAPWGALFPRIIFPRFHISIDGDFYVSANNSPPVHIAEKEIIMLPNGEEHWVADAPGSKLMPSEQMVKDCLLDNPVFRQGAITHRIMCGIATFDQKIKHPILESFADILHFPRFANDDPIWTLVTLLDSEMTASKGRGSPVVDRLTEILFIKLINHYAINNEGTKGFLASLRDRRIHHALTLIHKQPQFEWSLQLLSDQTGMSRATLTRRFQETTGSSPMAYITNWRMAKAYSQIKSSDISLDKVAESVGFSSARTLSKAFQRHYQITPSELRKQDA